MDATSALGQADKAKLQSLSNAKTPLDKERLKEQTDQFEAIMIKQLLDISLDTSVSLYGHTPGEDIYKSMYTDAISRQVTGSFGYSQLLYDYLTQK
jgi:Rod binding domain-containing protein